MKDRWWLIALAAAICAGAQLFLIAYYPTSLWTWVVLVAQLMFVVMLLANPKYWKRRTAAVLFSAGSAATAIPSVSIKVGDTTTYATFLVEGSATGAALAFCAGIALTFLDHDTERTSHAVSNDDREKHPLSWPLKIACGLAAIVFVATVVVVVSSTSSHAAENVISDVESHNATPVSNVAPDSAIRSLVKDAIARLIRAGQRGSQDAIQAVEVARQSGDLNQIQQALASQARQMERGLGVSDGAVRETQEVLNGINLEIAAIAFLRGDYADTQNRLETVLHNDPTNKDAINQFGRLLESQGDYRGAQKQFELLKNLAQGDKRWIAIAEGNLGLVNYDLSNYTEAEGLRECNFTVPPAK